MEENTNITENTAEDKAVVISSEAVELNEIHQTELVDATEKLDSIDFEGLNKAIQDLNDVVTTLEGIFEKKDFSWNS